MSWHLESEYLEVPGAPVAPGDLVIRRARELAEYLDAGSSPYAQLLECRRIQASPPAEAVVLEVDVERGQRVVHDIRRKERIAVLCCEDDTLPPEPLALRTDFPLVSHLNLRAEEFPRSLCLYDEPWSEVRLSWTVSGYVERLRGWLADTAKGELHAGDQPLEPLLLGSRWSLVLPPDAFEDASTNAPEPWRIMRVEGARTGTLLAQRSGEHGGESGEVLFVAVGLVGEAQEHGVIRKQPSTLTELHGFLLTADLDLIDELRARLRLWRDRGTLSTFLKARLVIVCFLPKVRESGGESEESDVWAFLCDAQLGALGEAVGAWAMHQGVPAALLGGESYARGDGVRVEVVNVTYAFTRGSAALFSGMSEPDAREIAQVGLGAIGSQLFANLYRMGYGRWTLIDPDDLAPHNLAKHELDGMWVGNPKALGLSMRAEKTVQGERFADWLPADVLKPGELAEQLSAAFSSATVILDTSASIPVARHLARDVESDARRVSIFFNPAGTDGVLLGEDAERRYSLDWLEMTYYRALTHDPALAGHLEAESERLRYGRSCRDLGSTVPQDLVALHAATGARALRAVLACDDAVIVVWRTRADDLGLKPIRIEPTELLEIGVGDWTVCTDRWLLDQVAEARARGLPDETGGVLVGLHDVHRRIVYVTDMIPSPPDSVEWPTCYIRGSRGLPQRLGELDRTTAGNLGYVGEWHSHPPGHSAAPSTDDRRAFAWLAGHMGRDGLPALMLIAGDDHESWYVGQMP